MSAIDEIVKMAGMVREQGGIPSRLYVGIRVWDAMLEEARRDNRPLSTALLGLSVYVHEAMRPNQWVVTTETAVC